ncbi:hypothetical protein ARALYDRAFT_495585 [Arabidopsis lyrata subsp. lyrata]|uniref:Uncharacterized protein n=1 Tax=Arabidopsis lyrata subsp. lyrata TaxID=81972 RepID=D7MUY9_ARALL|nr:hypothetical protein ARALYDRAFT_495585 [Arabidopsis lyrata subsp. lyrata]
MILYGGGGAGKDGGSTNHLSDGGVILKKGPWTAAEDEILAAYVRENGEGNWNAVQKNTGLARCGKSCRLRWANHLRPNLKKGSFTGDEERLIIQLHAQLGNKWARMAAQILSLTINSIHIHNIIINNNNNNNIIPNHQLHPHPQHYHQQQQQQQHNHHHHHHHHQQQQHHHQQMYFQPQSSQPNTPSSSPLPSPTPVSANANSSSSFTFHTTTANLLHPLSPHTPNTPQTPSQLSSTPPPPPLSSPLSSPRNNQYPTLPLFALPSSQINNNNANFTFPRPPPLLQPPSSLFAKRYNNANTPLNCINRVSTAPFSPVSRDSYTSFLTLPYPSPTAQTATYHNTNNNYSSSPSFSLNPSSSSSYPTATSSPSFLHSHYTPSSTSFHTNPVYSMKPEQLPSNQIPQIDAFNNVNNFTDNERQNHNLNSSGVHRRSSSCSLLEDVLEEAEALASGGRGRPPKRRQLTASPPNNNDNNNNDNFFSVSFGHYDSSDNLCSVQGTI